jgi:hypothetical protein
MFTSAAMQDFADMAEAHAWTLQRLREMAGRLTEQAYLRASDAAGRRDEAAEETHSHWMLVFDRMARGLRLSIALEAKLSRERRRDAAEIEREIGHEAQVGRHAPHWRRSPASQVTDAEPRESDAERDDDGLPGDAPLARRIGRLKDIIEGAGAPPHSGEPPSPLLRAERRALAVQRTLRAIRAASPWPPDEPWDVLAAAERVRGDDPPWRGSG